MSNIKSGTGNFIKDLPTWAKGTIAVGLTIGVIYAGYKIYQKISEKIEEGKEEKKDEVINKEKLSDNFANLPTVIGLGAKLADTKDAKGNLVKGNAYVVRVTPNKITYRFVFYKNGRIYIYNDKTNVVVGKGKYFDSGKIITLDSGKSFQYNSVWANMYDLIKGL
jgi:hypothetical protein